MTAALDRLDRVLEAQRSALLSGDLAALSGLVSDIEKALALVRGDAGDPARADRIARIARIAAENASLVRAAQTGLTRARHLIRRDDPDAELTTYAASGTRDAMTPGRPRLERRF